MKLCTYCGQIGNTLDHLVPVSYTSIKRHKRIRNTVPACGECNTVLGKQLFPNVASRAFYLFGYYQAKYRKILNAPG